MNVFYLEHFSGKARDFSAPLFGMLSESISTFPCPRTKYGDACLDNSAAFILKTVAIASILTAGVVGISIPLAGKQRSFLNTDSNHFVAAKAFAAGVILATGFVHMLPDGTSALTDSCLPNSPWSKFPFSCFFAMVASLATLVVDFVGTQFYERKNEMARVDHGVGLLDSSIETGSRSVEAGAKGWNEGVFGEEEGGGMHIVGIHAHAAHHRHSHPHGHEACEGHVLANSLGHSHGFDDERGVRHVVVSQILELGIISHSVIIGLSLGVSQSPCTVRPLIAALSFHQFFEGFALGGCISEAHFTTLTKAIMACFFALTTPLGVCVGMGISSFYNPDSPRGLVIEGVFDSVSAGILVYMALVDLIAADFLSKRMSCNVKLQVVSYFALFLGAMLMSSLAIWV